MRIAISGAGVAGTALAHWLHRIGHTPTLIEQAPAFRSGGYMIDFWGVGYQAAQRMGIEEQVRAAGYEIQCVRSVGSRGEVKADLRVEVFRRIIGDDFTSLPRGDLAAAVYRTIEGDVETLFSRSIAALDEHDDGVRVTFDNAESREFDLIIGADGIPMRAASFSDRNPDSNTTSGARSRPVSSKAIGRVTSWSTSPTTSPVGRWLGSPCAVTGRCFYSCSAAAEPERIPSMTSFAGSSARPAGNARRSSMQSTGPRTSTSTSSARSAWTAGRAAGCC